MLGSFTDMEVSPAGHPRFPPNPHLSSCGMLRGPGNFSPVRVSPGSMHYDGFRISPRSLMGRDHTRRRLTSVSSRSPQHHRIATTQTSCPSMAPRPTTEQDLPRIRASPYRQGVGSNLETLPRPAAVTRQIISVEGSSPVLKCF